MTELGPRKRHVAVTGLGTINSAGNNVPEFWQSMVIGQREGIIRNEREWLLEQAPGPYNNKLRSHLIARVKVDDLAQHLLGLNEPAFSHIDQRYIERYAGESAVLGMIAAAEAMKHANAYDIVEPKRFGIAVGTGIGGGTEISKFKELMLEGKAMPATAMAKSQPENAMVQLGIAYGAKGPNQTLTSACSSGNAAIIYATEKIWANRADMFMVVGTEAFEPLILAEFERTGAADLGEDPSTALRTLHREAGGTVVGNGASSLILEEYEAAKARGAEIYAVIAGTGSSNDAYDPTLPSSEGLEESMRLALHDAGITPTDYLHLNGHYTATRLGDPEETKAILRVFDGKHYSLEQIRRRVLGGKAITGHGLGGINVAEAISTVLTLHEGILPPSTWLADEAGILEGMEDLVTFPGGAKKLPVDAALSNGSGFGGQNHSVAFLSHEAFLGRNEL